MCFGHPLYLRYYEVQELQPAPVIQTPGEQELVVLNGRESITFPAEGVACSKASGSDICALPTVPSYYSRLIGGEAKLRQAK